MLTLALAYLLNSAPVATVETRALVAIYSAQGARAERQHRTDALGRWLDSIDGERIRAASIYSPFADDESTYHFEQE
jgi:hypothetical protein